LPPAGHDLLAVRPRPRPPRDRDAAEVEDGVDPVEVRRVELTSGRVPPSLVRTGRVGAHQSYDVMALVAEVLDQGRAEEAGRAGEYELHVLILPSTSRSHTPAVAGE